MQVRLTLRMSEIIMLVTALAEKKRSKEVSNIASASVSFELRSALEIWPWYSRLIVLMSGFLYCYSLRSIYKLLRSSCKCDAPHVSVNSDRPSVSPDDYSSIK
jgi:hypothetical protein